MGIVLVSLKRIALEWSTRLEFSVSNNEAEYKVLLARYQMANQVRATQVKIYYDSRLVTNQVNKEFEA